MLDKQWALNLPNIAPNIASQVLIFSIDTRILWVTWEMPVCFGCYVMLVFIHLSSVLVDTKVKDAWRAWSARGWRRCARQLMALRLARRPEVQQQFFCNGYNWHVAWVVVSTSSQSKLLWRKAFRRRFEHHTLAELIGTVRCRQRHLTTCWKRTFQRRAVWTAHRG